MKIPMQTASWLQFHLYLTTLDGYPPIAFIDENHKEMTNPAQRWQLAVETINRCLAAGLMDIWSNGWMKSVGLDNSSALVNALARHAPFNFEMSSMTAVYWLQPLLYSTDLCESLVNKYDLRKFQAGAVCDPFIEEIDRLFESSGVGWQDAPLVPIYKG